MATLSQRIRSLRVDNNLTQEEFGKIFRIVKSTVSLYESGKAFLTTKSKQKYAVTLAFLWTILSA